MTSARVNWQYGWASFGLLVFILSSSLLAMSPGGSYTVLNASSGPVWLQCGTVARPLEEPWRLARGFGDNGSGDHTELILLRVRYANGRRITFDAEHLRRTKAASGFRNGAWWIDDRGVTYLSSREANIRWRRFHK